LDDEDAFPLDPTRWSSETGTGTGIEIGDDADGDGVVDSEDDFPHDAAWSQWSDYEEFQVHEEIASLHSELYDDVNDIMVSISLATMDAQLTQLQDAQAGKVIRDRSGQRVRLENYILRPASNKVEALFLSHRRDGSHQGVSSLAFGVTFNQSLHGIDLKALPWSNYMDPSGDIMYSRQPIYYPNPGSADPAMVLTMRNPSNDYMSIYEGFSELTSGDGWYQSQLSLTNNMDVNGVLKTATYSGGTTTGGSYSVAQTFGDSTFYSIDAYVIDDAGIEQATDRYLDGSTQDLRIDSIRDVLRPQREHNLEIIAGATEFGGRTIDVIVAPEVMREYYIRTPVEVISVFTEKVR